VEGCVEDFGFGFVRGKGRVHGCTYQLVWNIPTGWYGVKGLFWRIYWTKISTIFSVSFVSCVLANPLNRGRDSPERRGELPLPSTRRDLSCSSWRLGTSLPSALG
jgi:hypothetical protein